MRPARFIVALVSLLALARTESTLAVEASDVPPTASQRDHDAAIRQAREAQAVVSRAQLAVDEARQQMDRFLAKHFEDHGQAERQPLPERTGVGSTRKTAKSATAEQLSRQLDELTARRDLLLVRLLPAHPEVVTIEGQIAEVAAKLTALTDAGGDAADDDAGEQQLIDALSLAHRRHQEAAQEFDALRGRLQVAESNLTHALAEAQRADARLAELKRSAPIHEAPDTLTERAEPVQLPSVESRKTADRAETPVGDDQRSQPLALAALVIALAVAALAAVKLARSGSDAVFASVDDVAAALALPVVGIIPLADSPASVAPAGRLARPLVLAGQILLATLLFALIAYGVQNPGTLWEACLHPLDTLSRIASYASGT
jgi:hypothetical protein